MKLFLLTLLSVCFNDYSKTQVFPNIPLKVEIMYLTHPFTQRAGLDMADVELG